VDFVKTPECLLCQEMVKEVEKKIVNKKSRAEIKAALEHACDRFPKAKAKCEKYIEEHGDRIIDLLLQQLSPKEICRDMMFCVTMEDDCK
jgi:saposin